MYIIKKRYPRLRCLKTERDTNLNIYISSKLMSIPTYTEYLNLDRDKSTFKSHRYFSSEKEITFKHS